MDRVLVFTLILVMILKLVDTYPISEELNLYARKLILENSSLSDILTFYNRYLCNITSNKIQLYN